LDDSGTTFCSVVVGICFLVLNGQGETCSVTKNAGPHRGFESLPHSFSTTKKIKRLQSARSVVIETMTAVASESQVQDEIDALNASITKQGAEVRTLKKEGGTAEAIAEAVAKLQALKIEHAEKSKLVATTETFNRKFFDDLILRKMFVVGAFEIHGGVKGLYDLGPPACALKVRMNYQVYRPPHGRDRRFPLSRGLTNVRSERFFSFFRPP
jgi:hypothetical protein